jgi:hypothetical protein
MFSRVDALNKYALTELRFIRIGQIFDKHWYIFGIGPSYLSGMLKLHIDRIGIAPAETSPNLYAERL